MESICQNGVITWENQQIDYPSCGPDMPEFEPRGCPRGASFSWYEYSPLRVKYPYIRGKLLDLWTEALEEQKGNRAAWASIVENEEKAKQYKEARGKRWTRQSKLERCHRYHCSSNFIHHKKMDRIVLLDLLLFLLCR